MNMQPITSGQGQASFREIALPEQADHRGALHGARALQMMGRAALACAARHAGGPVVMAKADAIEFARPVPAGARVDVRARIVFQGRSSMTVTVEIAPAPTAAPAITGRFMMVAVDGDGRPVPIPVPDQRSAEELRP